MPTGEDALLRLTIAAVATLVVFSARAQVLDYPTQPVRFVVPYAAGGGTDAMARFFAKGLETRLGQPFIVENRAGSGTTLGAGFVAKSPPDGYTILLGTSSTYAISVSLYKSISYDPAKDFAPIALVAQVPFVLVVHPSLPVYSVADLVRYAKANPGLNYASGGVGSQHHVNGELFRTLAGIDIRNVSYRGGGPAVQDVVAGHVKVMFADVGGSAHGLIREGKLRALAVTTGKRFALSPEIPTIAEAGYPGFEALAWNGVLVTAATPASIVQRLNTEINAILKDPEVKSKLNAQGFELIGGTPEDFARLIKSDSDKWAPVIAKTGARID